MNYYALLSVSNKNGIVDFAEGLVRSGYQIISSGGTHAVLQAEGIPVMRVSDYTGSPEILDGRVKTLHPKIHGGILAQRGNPAHDLDRKANDIGFIDINNPDEYVKNLIFIETTDFSFCRVKPSLGDDVLILGYPSIGSQTDITVTEGIISGYDGNYFITSAKIERGNSGGAAILVKDDCYLGIPSFAKTGSVESLSRILDINAVF